MRKHYDLVTLAYISRSSDFVMIMYSAFSGPHSTMTGVTPPSTKFLL